MKYCTKCEQTKPLADFAKLRDGLQPYCRACKSAYDKARYASNPAPAKARRNTRYANNPEQARRESRDWYTKHRERARTRQAAYNATHQEQKKRTDHEYRVRNLDRVKQIGRERTDRNRARWSAPDANPFDGTDKRCSRCHYIHPRVDDTTWTRTCTTKDGLGQLCADCRVKEGRRIFQKKVRAIKAHLADFNALPTPEARHDFAVNLLATSPLFVGNGMFSALVHDFAGILEEAAMLTNN